LQAYLDVKEPQLLESIATAAGISFAEAPALAEPTPGVLSAEFVAPIIMTPSAAPRLPFRVTFLEEARIALSSQESRAEETSLVFTFPRGASVEIGRGRKSDLLATEEAEPVDIFDEEETEDGRARAQRPQAFSIAAFDGVKLLALNPALKTANIKIPLGLGAQKQSSLKIKVPDNAVPGESYVYDVAERDSRGQLVGGVRLQVNVVR
jgi:hypothetical protein